MLVNWLASPVGHSRCYMISLLHAMLHVNWAGSAPVLAALIPVHPVAQAVAAVALAHPATVVALAVAAVARAQADLRIPAVAVFVPGTRVAQPALGPCLSTAGWAVPGHARCADTGRVLAVIADERGYARFVALIARCRCRDHDCSHSFMHGTQSMRYPPSSWHSRRLTP